MPIDETVVSDEVVADAPVVEEVVAEVVAEEAPVVAATPSEDARPEASTIEEGSDTAFKVSEGNPYAPVPADGQSV